MHGSAGQTLALAVGVGALVSMLCAKARVPALLPLLGMGIVLGRSGLGLVDSRELGRGLDAFIAAAIGLLIFEGALHLNATELRRAPRAIVLLLTVGAAITWAGAAMLAHWIGGLGWGAALLLGSILIVTGPTVVQPILRRCPLKPGLHAALGAEAVLIDPIGVLAVVTTLDVLVVLAGGVREQSALETAAAFMLPLLGGILAGAVVAGLARGLLWLLTRRQPLEAAHLNLLAVGTCMAAVGLGEWTAPQGGLVAATIAGVIMANVRPAGAGNLRLFKEQLATLLVGTLFILLASGFDIERLADVGWREGLLVVGLLLLVRPANILVSTMRSKLDWRERTFAALTAPRGIVAVTMATLAAAKLTARAAENSDPDSPAVRLAADAVRVETLVMLIVIVTVALASGFSVRLARLLNVGVGRPNGVLIIGANRLGLEIARVLKEQQIPVRLADSNDERVQAGRELGLEVARGDAMDMRWIEDEAMTAGTGWLFACTGNKMVDTMATRWGLARLGEGKAVSWSTRQAAAGKAKGESLRKVLDQLDRGVVRAGTWEAGGEGAVPIAAIERGQVRLLAGGVEEPASKNGGVKFVGLVPA